MRMLEARYPISLGRSGQHYLSFDKGILITVKWLFSYHTRASTELTNDEAEEQRALGKKPERLNVRRDDPYQWMMYQAEATQFVEVAVHHYGQVVETYSTSTQKGEPVRSLKTERGYELPLDEQVVLIVFGESVEAQYPDNIFASGGHPKDITISIAQR